MHILFLCMSRIISQTILDLSHKQSRYFAKEHQNYLQLCFSPTVGLSKFTIETDFHVSPYVIATTAKFVHMFSVFLRVNVFGVLSNLTLQTCCKQSCVEIEICVLFTYIRRLLHKACLYYNLLHCILHLIDNTINSDGHRRIFID